MTESLKLRFDFPSPIIQAQAVRHLVAAVLKEIAVNGQITQSSTQGPALEALWQQCCIDGALVRSACCDALVLLVDQGHADLHHVLNSVLNLLPSARNVQGLMKVIGRLLQMQADRRDGDAPFTCPYSIRSSPHPFITALENRADCWAALLLEIDDFIGQAADRSGPAYVAMLAPFLRYLYCEPHRQPQHALLRLRLLRVLVPVRPGEAGSALQDQEHTCCPVSDGLLRCLCELVPHMQVDSVEAVMELCGFADALLPGLVPPPERRWRAESGVLLLQLLVACQRCLQLDGDCRPLLGVLRRLLPAGRQALPLDELLMGVAMLLLEGPAAQQSSLLSLALSLIPEGAEPAPWLSPVLVLPVLQLLSCSELTEPLADRRTHRLNQDLARRLLLRVSREAEQPTQAGPSLALPLSSWYSELSVALSTLRKAASDPAAAADWLLSVSAALSSSHSRLGPLALVVAHLVITGREDVCQLALKAGQALAAADPGQGFNLKGKLNFLRLCPPPSSSC